MYVPSTTRAIDTKLFAQEISGGDHVARTELIKKQSLMGYKEDSLVSFIKIVTISSGYVPRVRDKCFHDSLCTLGLSFHTRLRKSPMLLPRIV